MKFHRSKERQTLYDNQCCQNNNVLVETGLFFLKTLENFEKEVLQKLLPRYP